MQLSNGTRLGTYPITLTPLGGGGFVTGGDISSDGQRMVHWTDVYGGYIRNVGDPAGWRQFMRPSNMLSAEYDPIPNPPGKTQNEGGFFGMRIAPSNKNVIYALWNSKLYKTTDGGATIRVTAMPLTNMRANSGTCRTFNRCIDVHPTDSNRVIVGSSFDSTHNDGVKYTTDGGTTWANITLPPASIDPGDSVSKYLVAYDPVSPLNVYVFVQGVGVHKSSTGESGTFSLITGGQTRCSSFFCTKAGDVFMGNYFTTTAVFNRLSRSGTMTSYTAPGYSATFLAVDDFNPNHWVVSDGDGQFSHTVDAGVTWAGAPGGSPGSLWYAHDTSPTYNKMLRGDGEIGWLSNNNLSTFPSHFFFDPVISGRLWRMEGVGVAYTDNIPTDWAFPMVYHDYSKGNDELIPLAMLSVPGKVEPFLTFWDKPIWKLRDQKNFTNYPDLPLSSTDPKSYRYSYVTMGDDIDYAIDDHNFLAAVVGQGDTRNGYSTDYGENWSKYMNLPVSRGVGGSIAVSNKNNIVILPSNNGGAYYTKDGGVTWLDLSFGGVSPVANFANAYYVRRRQISADKQRPGVFALVYTVISTDGQRLDNPLGGLWVTTDGGTNWTHKIVGLINTGSTTGVDNRQFWACELKYIPGYSGELLFTGHSDATADKLLWLQNDGATVTDIRSSVRNVVSFGFGKAAPGQTRPTVFFWGEVNGVKGLYLSLDWFATDPVSLARWVDDSFADIACVNGDQNIFGRCYVGLGGAGVRTINYSYKLRITAGTTLSPTKLAAGTTWTGAAGSGYSSIPSDPSRTTAKCFGRLVGVPNRVFTADHTLVVDADAANGGINKVRFYCEGNTIDVTIPQWTEYLDSNGLAKQRFGYSTSLDWSAISAKAVSGTVNVYAEVFANDTSILNRVIGPLAFHVRPVGQDYSITKTVGATGADFTNIKAAIDWFNTNSGAVGRNGRIQITTSGDFLIDGANTTYNNASHWLTIEAAGGVTCNITSGATRTTIRPFYDGLRFKGAGMVFDLAKFSLMFLETNTNLMQCWIDGVTIKETGGRSAVFDGAPPNQYWLAASVGGSIMSVYFTDCAATDCYIGYQSAKLVLNCKATTISDDFLTNVEYWQGVTIDGLNPASTNGLRYHVPAINVTYTGGGTAATIEATAAPGNARTMSLYKNGAQVGSSLTVTHPGYSPTGSGYTTWADIASWINTQGGAAGFAATVNGAAGTRRGSSVSNATLQAAPMTGSGALNVLGGSGVLTSWFDIHGDVLQLFSSGAIFSNYGGRFLKARNVNSSGGCQGFFIDSDQTSLQDCAFRNWDMATDGQGIIAVSQWHSPAAHVMLRKFSIYDQPFLFRTDALFNPDNRCEVTDSSFFSAVWSTTPDADLKINKINVRSGTLPSGATNSTTVTANLYLNPPSDLSAGTGMPLGVGARTSNGDWNVS